jgi:hypothetical protein
MTGMATPTIRAAVCTFLIYNNNDFALSLGLRSRDDQLVIS